MSNRTDMTDDNGNDTALAPYPANGNGNGNVNGNGNGHGDGRSLARPTTTWVEPQRVPPTASDGGGEAADRGGNELRRLHQMMRGRYAVAFALSALGLAGGAYGGFRAGHQVYSSIGQVRVMTVVPTVLYQVPGKGEMPAFDSYIDSQVALMKSPRVMESAMEDPAWRDLGRGASEAAAAAFLGAVTITREGEIIQVQAIDANPVAAETEVRTLIAAFQKRYDAQDALSSEKRLGTLRDRATARADDLKALRTRIHDIGQEYGFSDLKELVEFKQSQVNDLDKKVADLELELSNLIRDAKAAAGKGRNLEWTPDQWARVDPGLGTLIVDRNTKLRDADALVLSGKMDNYEPVVVLRKIAARDDTEIQDRVNVLRADAAAGRGPTPAAALAAGDGSRAVPADPDALTAEIQTLKQKREAMHQEVVALGQRQFQIEEFQNQAEQAKRDLDDARLAIDHTNVEATVSGRIEVISDGSRPFGAYKDTRVTFAAAGGALGAMLGFGLVLGLAAMDRRVRSPDEAIASVPARSILGLLPRLPDDLDDPARAALASHCVHEVRTGLQLWARHGRHRVFAITSPSAGAGKTSLTLALGISYATAKLRTLVVDLDLIGHGLTSRVDQIVTRRLGRVLVAGGHLSAGDLDAALEQSRSSGKRLGDVLVESGRVTREAVDAAVADQGRRVGVVDVTHGTPLAECVAPTGIPGLDVLGTGSATARDVPLLSPATVQHLVNLAGDAYDVVLIDTGPILGSLEAQLVSAVADGVVLTVSKGASRPLVGRAVEQLAAVGARFAGIVFNRASNGDLVVYSGSTSQARSTSVPSARPSAPAVPVEPGRAAQYGPLAVAVAQSAPDGGGSRPDPAE